MAFYEGAGFSCAPGPRSLDSWSKQMSRKAGLVVNGQAPSRTHSHKNSQVTRRILKCLNAVQKGVFSVRLPSDWTGLEGKLADSLNEIIAANERMARELKD